MAVGVLAVVVLVSAASIQALAMVLDSDLLRSPMVNSLLVGVLLVIAVQFPRLKLLEDGPGRRIFEMLGLLVPVVAGYIAFRNRQDRDLKADKDRLEADKDRLEAARDREARERAKRAANTRVNSTRVANLQQAVAYYGLTEIPSAQVAELAETEDREFEVSEIIERVAATVFGNTIWDTTPPGIEQQRGVLLALYQDTVRGQGGNLLTQQLEPDLIAPLADVLIGTSQVKRTAATRSQVCDELQALRFFYVTEKLLDRLSLVPIDAASRMRRVFDRYSILGLAGATWTQRDWNRIEDAARAMGGDQVKQCADLCAQKLAGTDRKLSSHLLRLIYFETFSPPTDGYWKKHKNSLLNELSALVADSGVLPAFVASDLRRAPVVSQLLDMHNSYSLPLLKGEVAALDRLRDTLGDYHRFLVDHRLASASPTIPADRLIDLVKTCVHGGLPQGERGLQRIALPESEIELLYGYGNDIVESMRGHIRASTWSMRSGSSPLPAATVVATSFVEAVSLVALHLHVCEEELATSDARVALARLTRRHGPEEAALVLTAYSIVADTANGGPVELLDVVGRWDSVLDDARAADRKELAQRISDAQRRLRTVARAPRPAPGDETARKTVLDIASQVVKIRDALAGLKQLVQENEPTSASARASSDDLHHEIAQLEATAEQLQGDLVERVDNDPVGHEWLVRPYLITFDERAGPLAGLLDALTSPDQRQQSTLAKLGVHLHVDEQAKYRFANFTRQARLGFLPRHMPFDEFLAEFERDLSILLKERNRVLGYELVQPGMTSPLAIEGYTPVRIETLPEHGSVQLPPGSDTGAVEYTPFSDDFRGSDQLILEDAVGERHVVRVVVRPDLSRIEVTLSRIHLAQFAELVVDHDARTIGREPSVENVLATLEQREQLDPIEAAIIRRHIGQIVGGVT